jgi:hypothetical protein
MDSMPEENDLAPSYGKHLLHGSLKVEHAKGRNSEGKVVGALKLLDLHIIPFLRDDAYVLQACGRKLFLKYRETMPPAGSSIVTWSTRAALGRAIVPGPAPISSDRPPRLTGEQRSTTRSRD